MGTGRHTSSDVLVDELFVDWVRELERKGPGDLHRGGDGCTAG